MKASKKTWCLILAACLSLGLLGACSQPANQNQTTAAATAAQDETTAAPETQPAETDAPAGTEAPTESEADETAGPAESQTAAAGDWEATLQGLYDHVVQAQIENAPAVRTLDSGVQVQRTPQDSTAFNTRILESDRRGCAACHTDLAATVDNYDLISNSKFHHFPLSNNLGIEIGEKQCLTCHKDSRYNPQMSTMLHSIHSGEQFEAMGGDCWSCHFADEITGELVLWDDVKYSVLQGINDVSDVEGEFTYNQDVLTDGIGFNIEWMYDDSNDLVRVPSYESGLTPDPENDKLADTWNIRVMGEVENELSFTLSELLETIPSETPISKTHCTIDPNGGGMIANVEITGIPLAPILEQAGIKNTATVISVCSENNDHYSYNVLSEIDLNNYFLVYEINGEPLPYEWGYPVCGWYLDQASACEVMKQATQIVLSDRDPATVTHRNNRTNPDGVITNRPNEAVMNFTEGQIIKAYEPYTFEGWADAYNIGVESIEFSFDRGQTWVTYDVSDTVISKWIYWTFTWTPPAEGSYVIMVRTVAKDGLVSYRPTEILFNAE